MKRKRAENERQIYSKGFEQKMKARHIAKALQSEFLKLEI